MTTGTGLPLFDFRGFSEADLADPYPIYRRYREQEPVHRVPGPADGGPDSWYVFGHDNVTIVLARPEFDRGTGNPRAPMVPAGYPALAGMVGNWLVFMDPPRHTRMRDLVKEEFTPRRVAEMRPEVATIADGLVADLPIDGPFDLVERFSAPFPIMVISRLLGVPWKRLVWFREVVTRLREGIASRVGRRADGYRIAEDATTELVAYFADEIARRRRAPGRDIISRLVAAADASGAMTDEEIAATSVHLLVAGHETTTNFLSKAVLNLAAHPWVADELHARPELLPAAVEELLRYDPPVQMVTRSASRPTDIDGHAVREGDRVVLVQGSANRDPARFADPDAISLARAGTRHRAFGGGPHFCLGAALARVEAEIGLRALLDRGLAPTGDPVPYAQDIVFHGPTALPVRVAPAQWIRSQM